MPGIKLLTAKISSPVKRVIHNASGKIRNLKNSHGDYFINFEKHDKKVEKGFFEFCFGEDRYSAIKRMVDKYKWVKDSNIKKHLNRRINDDGILNNQIYGEDLIDAYNVLQGHYSMRGDVDKYYKEYKKNYDESCVKYLVDSMKTSDLILDSLLSNYRARNDKGNITYMLKLIDFKHDSKTEALKKYVAKYSQEEPEMANYMYTKYYLPRLSKNIIENCEKISKDFGTKVFVYDEKEQPNLDFIYDELMDWKTKSNGDAKFPSIIDLSKIKEDYISKIEYGYSKVTKGFILQCDNSISLNYMRSIRHEMIHLNHKRPKLINIMIRRMDYGTIEIDKPYKEELIKFGINIDTAYKNPGSEFNELIAYAGSEDCQKYTTEFKSLLLDLGLPEWVFDLKPLRQIVEE